MKKIGLIGGLGPESTLDYYRGIIDAFKETYERSGYPEISMESMNLKSFMSLVESGRWDDIAEIMGMHFEVLRQGGAEIGAIASNTPHKVFTEIQKRTTLPLVSIVESTCTYAVAEGLGNLFLMGTQITMESDFYQTVFDKEGIALTVPTKDEQGYIQDKLFSEIEFGIIREETKAAFLSIIERHRSEETIDGVIAGCTELPLIIRQEDFTVPYLDTTAIHIAGIVETCNRP